jgi:hypothetical protein
MKQRNIFAVLFLSIITFGIYDLYWLFKTKKVLNQRTKIHIPTLWLLLVPFIIILALFIAVIAFSITKGSHPATSTTVTSLNKDGSSNSQTFSTTPKDDGVIPLVTILGFEFIAILVIVPITFYWYFKFSKAVNEFTHGELSTGVTFLLMWLLRFIGIMIVQDKFNDMLASGQSDTGQRLTTPIQTSSADDGAGQAPLSANPITLPERPTAPTAAPTIESAQTPNASPQSTNSVSSSTTENSVKTEEEQLFLPEHGVPDAPISRVNVTSDPQDTDKHQ